VAAASLSSVSSYTTPAAIPTRTAPIVQSMPKAAARRQKPAAGASSGGVVATNANGRLAAVSTVILGAARTPFTRLLGTLGSVSAVELGTVAARGAIERSGLAPEDVEYGVIGTVVQAGQGHIPSRQVTLAAGIPENVGSETVNKVCASGLRAIAGGDPRVRRGEHRVILAGGMESMSSAPYLALGARRGLRFGDVELADANQHDGLRDPWTGRLMYEQAGDVAADLGISREEQDAWAARSQQRAAAAQAGGRFAEEIVPVEVRGRSGAAAVELDEGIRADTTAERLAGLPPLVPGGTHTAGNSPGVNDGAAAVVLAHEDEAARRGLPVLARIRAVGYTADQPQRLARVPALASRIALEKVGLTPADVDRWEINEAFASVAVNSSRMLEVDPERVNVNGGAVALGHPIGASGARLIVTLVHELRRQGGGIGVAAICSGGGQGDAMVIEVPRG
jgi:acetyl-CoA C-acetyltransferase